MIVERQIAAYLCKQWADQLDAMHARVMELHNVLVANESDDGSHEITAISEAQNVASRIQEACNQMRSGIGRAFPTEQENRAAQRSPKGESDGR